jgi:hypothetical protein
LLQKMASTTAPYPHHKSVRRPEIRKDFRRTQSFSFASKKPKFFDAQGGQREAGRP